MSPESASTSLEDRPRRLPPWTERTLPFALTYPALALVVALIIIPVIYEFVLSLTHYDVFSGDIRFNSFANYERLADDERFHAALSNTLWYASTTTFAQLTFGLFLAWAVFRASKRTSRWLRAVCFVPYVLPVVSTVLVFDFMFDSRSGLLSQALSTLGFSTNWHSQSGSFWLLVLVSIWQFTPFVFVIVLARLESIPAGMLEAAEADGASPWSTFRFVVFPHLRSTLFAAALLRFAFMFTKFDTPWLLAGARGTNRYVETLPVYTFRLGFEAFDLAAAAACGIALFLVSAASILLLVGFSRNGRAAA